MENIYKEARFDLYCEKCKYEKKKDYEDPCDECHENGMVAHTEKPINFEEKEETKR